MSTPIGPGGFTVTSCGTQRPPGLVELATERCPALGVADLEFVLDRNLIDDDELVVARQDGSMIGWALRCRRLVMPPQWRSVRVFVRREWEGRGVGGALHAALATDEDAEQWRAVVFDDDDRALAVALSWGYQVVQHSITSRVDLGSAAAPPLPDDVSIEPSANLEFADADRVEAMLDVSQTNPERGHGLEMTLGFLRGMVGEGASGLHALLRVDGRPAAITSGSITGDQAHLTYTGVDPAYRGRGLAQLLKQSVHAQAASAGARWCYTDNEEGNLGIRRVNESLGYQKTYGELWLARPA